MRRPYGHAGLRRQVNWSRGPDCIAARPPPLPMSPPATAWSHVITATDLELRAGSRILLSDATLRVQAGDRIGLVGRNGAGKTTSMRVLAGEGEPYGGPSARPAPRLPAAGPARGRPHGPGQGPGALRARSGPAAARHGEGAVGDGGAGRRRPARQRGARLRPYRGAVLRARWLRRGERRRPDLRESRAAGPRAAPDDADALGRAAAPRGAGPDPVRRLGRLGGGAPSGRLCCSTSPRTTSTPTRSPGCARSSPPTTAAWW